jgi:type I restriction enzyme R subunit
MPINEADTCRTYVVPKLYSAGWEDTQISEQKSFTDGRIMLVGNRAIRRPQKRADYLLRYRRDFPIAVVEAKAAYRTAGDGLQQAKEYAQILGLKFAYATNGHSIIEHDFLTGLDNELQAFPKPSELWARLTGAERSRRRWETASSRPTTTCPANRRDITKRSLSTWLCSASSRAGSASS